MAEMLFSGFNDKIGYYKCPYTDGLIYWYADDNLCYTTCRTVWIKIIF